MTEIVMLVWLGDVAHNVSFLFALLLVVGLVTGACIAAVVAGDGYEPSRALARWVAVGAVGAVISALALALIPSKDTIYLYAAARAVQIAETTELGSEVYAALLRSLREVSPAK